MILGIDLGTTYSAVATTDAAGRPRILPNSVGELTTPSCVHFAGPGDAVVGSAAKEERRVDADNTVALVKRHMGTDFPMTFHGVDHTPESVSSILLRALVADARAELNVPADEEVRAVVTVPAYFGLREREATQQAADLAGIEVLELVAEPVAAALHYGVADRTDRTMLVYDLGGGTFDCTVLRTTDGSVAVLATDGDASLGGADIDQRLAGMLLDRLAQELPADVDPPHDDIEMVEEAIGLAESTKRSLGSKQSHRVVLRYGGVAVRVDVDRAMVLAASQDLVDRTMAIVERLLATAGGVVIDEVLLVGGSSRLPVITEVITARFGRAPLQVDPELAVALGAAVRAERLARPVALRGADPQPSQAVAVLPRAVGVLVRDSFDPAGLREFVQHVVAANTPLPARVTAPFATIIDRQHTVRIQVFEQAGAIASDEFAHNRRVLDGEFTGLPELPAGARIDVTLAVGLDGRLTVTARDVLGSTSLQLEAYMDGVVDGATAQALSASTGDLRIRQ